MSSSALCAASATTRPQPDFLHRFLNASVCGSRLLTISGAPGGGRTFELTGWRGGSRAAFLRFPGRVRKESRLPWHHVGCAVVAVRRGCVFTVGAANVYRNSYVHIHAHGRSSLMKAQGRYSLIRAHGRSSPIKTYGPYSLIKTYGRYSPIKARSRSSLMKSARSILSDKSVRSIFSEKKRTVDILR